MGSVDRLVVNTRDPRILIFDREGWMRFRPRISYGYCKEDPVKKNCPRETRLVDTVACGERISSAVGSGHGVYFLLGNRDEARLGNSYLGFIGPGEEYSLTGLDDKVSVSNSFFVEVFNDDAKSWKKSDPHLLLAHGGTGYTSLHKLKHEKRNLGGNEFYGSCCDLVWSDERKSFLILRKNGGLLDSGGKLVGNVGEGARDFFGQPVSEMHYTEGLIEKLNNSPSYEGALVLG